jgi:REP element-mobilizing transposase RayT
LEKFVPSNSSQTGTVRLEFKMKFLPDNIYHIYNQGNNHQDIFLNDEDYLIFLRMLRKHIHSNTEIIAWCLMPNHFHLLVYTDERSCERIKQGGLEIEKLTNGIRKLLSGYARVFNKRYNRMGSVFRQKTKAKNVAESDWVVKHNFSLQDYCSRCFDYIHQNPVVSALVKQQEDWKYSSYCDYAGLRNGTLCNKELAAKYCGFDIRNFNNSNNKPDNDFLNSFEKDD